MSNKKDILIVGTLSVILFAGFTVYNHSTGVRHGRTRENPGRITQQQSEQPPDKKRTTSVQSINETPTEQPPTPVRNKTTRTKAS